MGLIKNNWKDRQRIREEEVFHPLHGSPEGITPVLLTYWTQEYQEVYLIPATQEELEKLSQVNGIDCNGTGWEKYSEVFDYIESKRYDRETGEKGQWKDRYLVDTRDENDQPLPPITLPPGTVVIITGFIL